MTVRRFWLKVHLYTGLATALFLVVVGLTGSVLAFEPDYDHWMHPALWRVGDGARLAEQTLIDRVQRELGRAQGPARVARVAISGAGLAQVFSLTNGTRAYVDPRTGAILGVRRGPTRLERVMLDMRVVHTELFAGEWGRLVVDVITAILALLVIPVGAYLWWHAKRARVTWRSSSRRLTWDSHNVIGLYTALALLALGITGVFLAYEPALYWIARTSPVAEPRVPRSTVPDTAGVRPMVARPTVDSLMVVADRALPGAATYEVRLASGPRSSVQMLKRGSGAGTSAVYLDQYSGRVLRVDDFGRAPRAYRAHVMDQAIHLGAVYGFPTRIVAALSGLALVTLVATGVLMWWRKLV